VEKPGKVILQPQTSGRAAMQKSKWWGEAGHRSWMGSSSITYAQNQVKSVEALQTLGARAVTTECTCCDSALFFLSLSSLMAVMEVIVLCY